MLIQPLGSWELRIWSPKTNNLHYLITSPSNFRRKVWEHDRRICWIWYQGSFTMFARIADLQQPLMGTVQERQGVIPLPADRPSQAIVDVSENMRAKIYSMFCKLGKLLLEMFLVCLFCYHTYVITEAHLSLGEFFRLFQLMRCRCLISYSLWLYKDTVTMAFMSISKIFWNDTIVLLWSSPTGFESLYSFH